jgi:hypothetical protein
VSLGRSASSSSSVSSSASSSSSSFAPDPAAPSVAVLEEEGAFNVSIVAFFCLTGLDSEDWIGAGVVALLTD